MSNTFEFTDTQIEIIIQGHKCVIDVGDADMQDRLLKAATIAQTALVPDEDCNKQASEKLRSLARAILGDEACDAIYDGVPLNVYKDVELFLFLRQQMDDAEPTKRFDNNVLALDALLETMIGPKAD